MVLKVCFDNGKFFRIPCTCVKPVIKNAEHERLNSEIFYTHHSVIAPVYKWDAFTVKEVYPPPPNSNNSNKPTEHTVMDLESYNLFHMIDSWLYWFHKWKKKSPVSKQKGEKRHKMCERDKTETEDEVKNRQTDGETERGERRQCGEDLWVGPVCWLWAWSLCGPLLCNIHRSSGSHVSACGCNVHTHAHTHTHRHTHTHTHTHTQVQYCTNTDVCVHI